MRLIPLASLLLSTVIVISCSSAGDNPAQNSAANRGNDNATNSAKDSVDDLSMMIKLPFEPEEATWKEPQPGENKLTAVLLYSADDATKFASHLAAQGEPTPETITAEDWFPSELRSQGDISGESTLKGRSYGAGDVLQPPYTDGKVTQIDDSNYFVVQLRSESRP